MPIGGLRQGEIKFYTPQRGETLVKNTPTPTRPYTAVMPATGGEFAFKSDGTRVTVPLGFFDTTTFDKKKADNMADATKISTDTQLMDEVGTLAAGLPAGTPQVKAVSPTVKAGEIQQVQPTLIASPPTVPTSTADITGITALAPTVSSPSLGQVDSIPTGYSSVSTGGIVRQH
jgi:hypothetical protein